MNGERGFTIQELAVATLAAAVALAAAVPAWRGWLPGLRLRSAVNELQGVVRLARISAVRAHAPCRVVFDTDARTCRLEGGGQAARTVRLDRFGSGVGFGPGGADFAATVSGGAIPRDGVSFPGNRIVFDGCGNTRSLGYVYLSCATGEAWALGVTSLAGVQVAKHWSGSGWR